MAVILSCWLSVYSSYFGPDWQYRLFKSITLLLLVVLAKQAPDLTTTGYLIIFGLLVTLIGNILLELVSNRLPYVINALFICNVLYAISFTKHMNTKMFSPLLLMFLTFGVALIILIWSKLYRLCWLVFAYISVTILMVWFTGTQYLLHNSNYSMLPLAGATLLLVATTIWLINYYCYSFNIFKVLFTACYFTGHFLIVCSLYF